MADCRIKNNRNVREYWPRCAPFDKAKPAGEDPAIDAAPAVRRDGSFLLADRLELVNSPAAVFDDVKIVPRIYSDTMSLIELARQVSDLSQAGQELAGLALDYIDLRIVLVDDEHEGLGCIA